jgi:hypothetical protein
VFLPPLTVKDDYVASSSDEDEPQEALASKLESKRKELIHIEQVDLSWPVNVVSIEQIRMELEKLDAESNDEEGFPV